jgi:hypothetical protein
MHRQFFRDKTLFHWQPQFTAGALLPGATYPWDAVTHQR